LADSRANWIYDSPLMSRQFNESQENDSISRTNFNSSHPSNSRSETERLVVPERLRTSESVARKRARKYLDDKNILEFGTLEIYDSERDPRLRNRRRVNYNEDQHDNLF